MIKVTDIIWSIDFDDAYEAFKKLSAAEAVEVLGHSVTKKAYESMTDAERRDYTHIMFNNDNRIFYELLGLPEECEFNSSLYEEYSDLDIEDLLSEKYEYCLVAFVVDRDVKDSNPEGTHFYGKDLDYNADEDEYITNVHEENFDGIVTNP